MPEFDRRPTKKTHSSVTTNKTNGRKMVIRRKENVAVSILRGLFPWKGDTGGDVVRKFIFLASLILITWAAIRITDFYVFRPLRADNDWQFLTGISDDYDGPDMVTIVAPARSGSDGGDNRTVEVIGEYLQFYEMNDDFVGRVKIYPWIQHNVYQADDNVFYLNHNHNRVPTVNGTIFADWEGRFSETERPHCTVIYGHNLLTRGLFFPLTYYRPGAHGFDSFQFLKDHPVIQFDTLYERGHYKIFAVFQSNVWPHQGEVFMYWDNIYFDSKPHFDNFVADILDRSLFYTNVELEYGDELLLLSTCDFSIFANGADSSVRIVVAARRVRDTEFIMFSPDEIDAFIDNRGVNESNQLRRKMFQAYYDLRHPAGWAGRSWNPAYIKDFAAY